MNKRVIGLVGFMTTMSCWALNEQAVQPTVSFGPGVILILDGVGVQFLDVIDNNVEQVSDDVTRSKKGTQNAATVLLGIAQACGQVGDIVAAESDHEKKQGILSLLGTVFSVAAQLTLSGHRAYGESTDEIKEVAADGATVIALRFFDVLDFEKDPLSFIKDNTELTALYLAEDDEQRVALIKTSFKSHSQVVAFLQRLLVILQRYIAQITSQIISDAMQTITQGGVHEQEVQSIVSAHNFVSQQSYEQPPQSCCGQISSQSPSAYDQSFNNQTPPPHRETAA